MEARDGLLRIALFSWAGITIGREESCQQEKKSNKNENESQKPDTQHKWQTVRFYYFSSHPHRGLFSIIKIALHQRLKRPQFKLLDSDNMASFLGRLAPDSPASPQQPCPQGPTRQVNASSVWNHHFLATAHRLLPSHLKCIIQHGSRGSRSPRRADRTDPLSCSFACELPHVQRLPSNHA